MTRDIHSVGVIGLGAMGMGVAQSLLRGGFEVHACDVRADAVQRVVDAGGHRAISPVALGKLVDALIILVVNAEQTEAVLFGENGAAASRPRVPWSSPAPRCRQSSRVPSASVSPAWAC